MYLADRRTCSIRIGPAYALHCSKSTARAAAGAGRPPERFRAPAWRSSESPSAAAARRRPPGSTDRAAPSARFWGAAGIHFSNGQQIIMEKSQQKPTFCIIHGKGTCTIQQHALWNWQTACFPIQIGQHLGCGSKDQVVQCSKLQNKKTPFLPTRTRRTCPEICQNMGFDAASAPRNLGENPCFARGSSPSCRPRFLRSQVLQLLPSSAIPYRKHQKTH